MRLKILPLLQAGERYWFPDEPETPLPVSPEPVSPEHSLPECRRAENSRASVPFLLQRGIWPRNHIPHQWQSPRKIIQTFLWIKVWNEDLYILCIFFITFMAKLCELHRGFKIRSRGLLSSAEVSGFMSEMSRRVCYQLRES